MENILVTGPPGVGKTTFAKRAAKELADLRPQGFFIEERLVDSRRVGFELVALDGSRANLNRDDAPFHNKTDLARLCQETQDRW